VTLLFLFVSEDSFLRGTGWCRSARSFSEKKLHIPAPAPILPILSAFPEGERASPFRGFLMNPPGTSRDWPKIARLSGEPLPETRAAPKNNRYYPRKPVTTRHEVLSPCPCRTVGLSLCRSAFLDISYLHYWEKVRKSFLNRFRKIPSPAVPLLDIQLTSSFFFT
jgi:hypothetical protein